MKTRSAFTKVILVIILMSIIAMVVFTAQMLGFIRGKTPHSSFDEYSFDVKIISMRTKIQVSKDDEKIGYVTGNILRFVTDPLTMYDNSDNPIAYAGDAYRIISQDSHGIYVNNKPSYDMVGQFSVFGNKYEIYDCEKNHVGKMKFDPFNLIGTMYDESDNIVATYFSPFLRRDFKVKVYEECKIDETALIMMFASYYSDFKVDSSK